MNKGVIRGAMAGLVLATLAIWSIPASPQAQAGGAPQVAQPAAQGQQVPGPGQPPGLSLIHI